MAKILGTSIGKTSSIVFLVLVIFIALALSNVSFLVSNRVAGPPFRLEGMTHDVAPVAPAVAAPAVAPPVVGGANKSK
jgi:hypothetical protein